MATAEKLKRFEVERVEIPARIEERLVEKDVVTLTISAEEAQFLAELGAMVGGDIHNSARKYMDNITAALVDVGYRWSAASDLLDPIIKTAQYFAVGSQHQIEKLVKERRNG